MCMLSIVIVELWRLSEVIDRYFPLIETNGKPLKYDTMLLLKCLAWHLLQYEAAHLTTESKASYKAWLKARIPAKSGVAKRTRFHFAHLFNRASASADFPEDFNLASSLCPSKAANWSFSGCMLIAECKMVVRCNEAAIARSLQSCSVEELEYARKLVRL